MTHDSRATPSQVSGAYWIEAKAPPGSVPPPTARPGCWRIVTTLSAVDALWAAVKAATEAGELGYKSKVATAPAPGQTSPDARSIHILTADAADTAEVQRIDAALQRLLPGVQAAFTAD